MRISLRRSSPYKDWTAADYDSFEVLVAAGVRRPAARVSRARASRPVRRAVRAALRSAHGRTGRRTRPATEPLHSPAN
ncbi:hypothetical protein [Actinacidiphila sp. ITFR-21]|uniref:hypothetical protein n=1 Tax=Actinacidiphila sp. ITFR-21 TaxID=3075199 RepID=UPI002889E67E|nr:hypothetical protein [Streptomyces sp. ITFR-21]WNI20257.1 hypothetical protein RLT57_32445 [Streptomyces sp. ITFR-21]